MNGRRSHVLRGVIDWLIHKPLNRLVLACLVWGAAIISLVFVVDRVMWVGFALGVLLPVSLWIAYDGLTVPAKARLDYFLALTPREFEETVAELIVPLGFTDVRVVGGAADLGVDVLCRDRAGRLVAIQCKRYQPDNDISSSAGQTFIGGMVVHKAARGIMVTTSSFSAPARDLARDQGIRLIDGAELTRMLAQEEGAS